MRKHLLGTVALAAIGLLFGSSLPALAEHEDRPRTKNLHPMGHLEEPASLLNPEIGNPDVHTDMAFWGKYAFQGTWLGFDIRNISAPGNPKQISHTTCERPQGDMIIWENILVRTADGLAPAPFECDGVTFPEGFGGLHIFDVSDVTNPVLITGVQLPCGAHTATAVPDPENNRLLVYGNSSSADCEWIDIVEIPLDDPESAEVIGVAEAGRWCHDTGVILGDVLRAACAGADGFTVFSLDPADGGALDSPVFLYSKNVNEAPVIDPESPISIGHSAAFTWDGEVIIFGHEPGGGALARCREEDPDSDKSAFFFDADTGEFLGMWTLPRPQTAQENCTIHVYNLVPTRSGSDILVLGNYQAGTWVVDITDPANPVTLAWSDPDPLPVPPPPFDFLGLDLGGAWSSYWYNNFIYETNITQGLNIFRFSGKATGGALRLPHLNPQTQEFTIR
ncbi:MAG TPA: hypothetical protein VFZ63_03795 [Jiangellaceae bacterium]